MTQTSSEGPHDPAAGPATDDVSRPDGSPHAGASHSTTGAGLDASAMRDLGSLRRSTVDRKVAGVAGGLGRHFGIDPILLRVLFVVAAFFGGAGLVAYVAFWLFVPREDTGAAVLDTTPSTRRVLLIAVAIFAALLVVGDSWGGGPGLPFVLIPLGIAAILYVVFKERGGGGRPAAAGTVPSATAATQAGPDAPTTADASSAQGPPGAPGATDWSGGSWSDPTPPTQTGSGDYGPPWTPAAGPAYPPPEPPAPAPPRRRKSGPRLFWPTLAIIAVAWGLLGLVEAYGGGVVDGAYPATALAAVGAMLVVGARVGRPGGLLPLGVILALVLGGTTFGGSFDDPTGPNRRVVVPDTAAAVQDVYRFDADEIALDLTEVQDLDALDGRSIRMEGTAGDLLVLLPAGLDADVKADIAAAGQIDLPDRSTGGLGPDVEQLIDADPGTDDPTIDLELDLVVGHIEVRQ